MLGFRKLAVVLERGELGSWESAGVRSPAVLYDRRSFQFRMWYSAFDSSTWRIGYAFSNDGLTWFRHAEPVLQPGDPGAWDSKGVFAPWVVQDGDTLRMWYTGEGTTGRSIGAAYSVDGVYWTREPRNPLLQVSGGADEPAVIRMGSGLWLMLFTLLGSEPGIGAARSEDGVRWSLLRQGAVFSASDAWDRRGVGGPSLLSGPNGLQLFYAGRREDGSWAIGQASSADGVSWVRVGGEPVLTPGGRIEWDGLSVASPMALRSPDESSLLLYYSGTDGSWWRIGLARQRL